MSLRSASSRSCRPHQSALGARRHSSSILHDIRRRLRADRQHVHPTFRRVGGGHPASLADVADRHRARSDDAADPTNEPIHACIERWHRHVRGQLPGGLDELLHEDCVFFSPIVFTPQRGREITKLYLRAAGSTLADADLDTADSPTGSSSGTFRYVKEIRQGHHAMLEFETSVDVDGEPKYANGVDIISCDDDGRIVEFKVMMRPLQAINAVHAQMAAMLQQLAD